jgi:hypothetical protein
MKKEFRTIGLHVDHPGAFKDVLEAAMTANDDLPIRS